MTINMIGAIVFLLALFGLIVSILGFMSFSEAFKKEYSNTTFHMAETAAALVDGDYLDDYLAGDRKEEYEEIAEYLDAYCKAMSVSLVYVIDVDTSDYGRFVSIFNSVNNTVDETNYEPWPLGYKRDTTNDEYREKYRALYEKRSLYETVYRKEKTAPDQDPHITTIVQVPDSNGDVAGLLCIQRPISELYEARIPYVINIAVTVVIMSVVVSVLAAVYLRRQFVIPIQKVSDEARRFSRDNSKGETLGHVSRINEISSLASSIDSMESDMIAYIDHLTVITAEKERIGTELALASQIQENSVPNEFPAFPDRDDFDIYASMTPAKEVGGDLYNFFLIDDDHLAVMIGDVSGKGVPASLFMMVTNILLRLRTKAGGTPGEILSVVNNDLYANNNLDMFVTIWLGIYEFSTGKLTYANAGHENPAVFRKSEVRYTLDETKHSLCAGGINDVSYRDREITLESGDRLFVYTDGIPEAKDGENRMFGIDRMLNSLNSNSNATLKGTVDGIYDDVNSFIKDAPQFDDMTMLCLEIK